MNLHGISTTGFVLTTLLASMAPVSAANAEFEEDYIQPMAPREEQMDPETQARFNAVDNYYSSEGVYLTQDQIQEILADQPETVDYALSYPLALQGTNGTAHFEVNGEGQIHSQTYCPDVFIGTCFFGKWAGAYVHTPDEDEVLLGYRYEGRIKAGNIRGQKAVWGLTSGGEVTGELGSTSTSENDNIVLPRFTTAYGVRGEANSESANSNYGVYGKSTQANGVGVYGANTTAGGRAGQFDGPVGQDNGYGGIVKAAVYLYCFSGGSNIRRSFGPVGTTATVAPNPNGGCMIDLGFDVSQRYFQATAVTDKPEMVSCNFGTDVNTLACNRYNEGGISFGGFMMLTIY